MRRKLPKQPNLGSVASVYDEIEQFLIYEWLKVWLDLQYRNVLNKISLDDLLQPPDTIVDKTTGDLLGHSTTRPIRPAQIEDHRTPRPAEANAVARLVLSGDSKNLPTWQNADVDVLLECWGPGMNRRASDVHCEPIAAPCQAAAVADPVREGSYVVGYLPAIDINVIVWWNPLDSASRAWPLAIGWFPWGEDIADACEAIIGAFRRFRA